MIIRSQDKEKIIDTNNIVIDILHLNNLKFKLYEEQNGYLIFAYHSNDIDSDKIHKLGIYSTKEKAIKVLDMILARYQEPIYQNDIGDNEIAIYKNIVFQMPQNEEVDPNEN